MTNTTPEGHVLLGYGHWNDEFQCPNCGSSYCQVVAGPAEASYCTIECYCGATRRFPRHTYDQFIHSGQFDLEFVPCPVCDQELQRNNPLSQAQHMQDQHPDVVSDRRR